MNTQKFLKSFPIQNIRRVHIFSAILLGALVAFEVFNYSTTDYALNDLLGGNLKFAGIRWSTILALAFCGIDFAGLARLFTPEQGNDEPAEVWYLFGAWILAAGMNATLTWWGISLALVSHDTQSAAILAPGTLTNIVPVFVAIMVWVIRILIIGTFSTAGERLFTADTVSKPAQAPKRVTSPQSRTPYPQPRSTPNNLIKREPTYRPVGMTAKPNTPQQKEFRN
jgi:hypothetical protein